MNYIERLEQEQRELEHKTEKLSEFIGSSTYNELSEYEQRLLKKQFEHMVNYDRILLKRLSITG